MFQIGDKVVYPMHGAGVITAIEEKEVLGERHKYYVMNMPVGKMKVMIPIANVHSLGLRDIIPHSEIDRVFDALKGKDAPVDLAWNRRYRANMEKIRSGNIFEVAEVIKSLASREHNKGLSTGEKKMYENACQILVSELVLAGETEEDSVRSMLDQVLENGA